MEHLARRSIKINDIGVNNYLHHTWIVNLEDVDLKEVERILKSLNNQGCVTISIHAGSMFEGISDDFRAVISQISSCAIILVVITYDGNTNLELLNNIVGYMRCCQTCIIYTGREILDATKVTMGEVEAKVGNLLLNFGKDDLDDLSLNSGSISNALRYNCISWCKEICQCEGYYDVLYVGWHLLSYIFGMELGVKMIVYEMASFLNPYDVCMGKRIKSTKKCNGYDSPNAKVKLGALFSWALVNYDSIIVIGGYPCKELRRMYKFIKNFSKQVVLIDPAFSESMSCDNVRIIKGEWEFSNGIDENLMSLCIKIEYDNCIIMDDSWVSKGKWEFLKTKLKSLKPYKKVDVSIKMNWYNDSTENSIWVDSLNQIMLIPGTNDSTESRLLLKFDSYGNRVDKNDYNLLMNNWKTFSMAEQCFMFGYYFANILENKDILTEEYSLLTNNVILSLYALGNKDSDMNIATLKDWNNVGIKYIINLYTDINNDGKTVAYKRYRDIVYAYDSLMDLYKSGTYTLTFDKLYNILVIENTDRRGFRLMGDLDNIQNTVNESNKRMLITNFTPTTEMKYQSSTFSFASRLKWVTVKLRAYREIGMESTYMLRYNILANIFEYKDVMYNSDKHSLILNMKSRLNWEIDIFKGKRKLRLIDHLELDKNKCMEIEVSGHVLNLLIWEMLEPGNLMLWLRQIIFYYNNLNCRLNSKDKPRRDELLRLWNLGYFIETSSDRLDKKWHTKLEMLLACIIAKEYWNQLLKLSDRELNAIGRVSIKLYDIFMCELP